MALSGEAERLPGLSASESLYHGPGPADVVPERVSERPGDARREHEGRSGTDARSAATAPAMSEGIVNNLMNHQGVRHARWKGLALARFQVGSAILLLNTLKWHKIRHSQLRPMTLQPAV